MNHTFSAKPTAKTPLVVITYEDDRRKPGKAFWDALPKKHAECIRSAFKSGSVPKKGFGCVQCGSGVAFVQTLSDKKKATARDAREAGEQLKSLLKPYDIAEAIVSTDSLEEVHASAYAEGVVLGGYEYEEWKGKEHAKAKKHTVTLRKVSFTASAERGQSKRLKILAESVALTKDLINAPPRQVNPSYMEATAKRIAKKHSKVKLTCLKEKELKKLGCEGLMFVGLGSSEQSRLLILEYKGGGKERPVALVGKGVTYDTGGLSLKPPRYMVGMKQDLGGAATVLGAFNAIVASGIKKNVMAVVPTVENNVDADSYKPDDILRMYNGVTVEVTNTDAEGRLILADALAYICDKKKPRAIVDLATLTGACAYAVGNDFSAALGTDDNLMKAVIDAGKEVDELMWELPLHQRYKKLLKSPVADIVNSADKLKAGTIEGGLFLQHFVEEGMPWVHLDIASVAFDDSAGMATGRNVRALWKLLEDY